MNHQKKLVTLRSCNSVLFFFSDPTYDTSNRHPHNPSDRFAFPLNSIEIAESPSNSFSIFSSHDQLVRRWWLILNIHVSVFKSVRVEGSVLTFKCLLFNSSGVVILSQYLLAILLDSIVWELFLMKVLLCNLISFFQVLHTPLTRKA